MSILDNIRFGDPNLTFTAVEGATKLSQVYDDIVAMPQGFDTIIGEKGVSLFWWPKTENCHEPCHDSKS